MQDISATSMQERDFWLGFSAFSGIGPARFKKLVSAFGNAKNAWEANEKSLQGVLGENTGNKFDSFKKDFSIEQYKEKLLSKKIWFLTLADKKYPELLKQTANPPFVLYGKGNVEILLRQLTDQNDPSDRSGQAFAVVGSRKTTQYGRDVTESLVTGLSQAGLVIVSGLAMGVDAVAHMTALENEAKTIAVLGCGVDCCFPTMNQNIYNSILEDDGVIISEQPPSHPPSKGSFPSRNRIIAGLSVGVLVTEGAEDSGSLITADYAFMFGRKVFAVPGPINASLSKGPLKLIRKGAKMVGSAEEILEELKLQIPNPKSQINSKSKNTNERNISKDEKKVLELLATESLSFDEIARRLQLDPSDAGTLLTMMEIKGMIRNVDGATFSIAS